MRPSPDYSQDGTPGQSHRALLIISFWMVCEIKEESSTFPTLRELLIKIRRTELRPVAKARPCSRQLTPEGLPASLEAPTYNHRLIDSAQFSFSRDLRSSISQKCLGLFRALFATSSEARLHLALAGSPGTNWLAQKVLSPQGLPGWPVCAAGPSGGVFWLTTTSLGPTLHHPAS